jgi:hypothetical protein
MAKCVVCGAETNLFVNKVPICAKCDDEQEKKRMKEESEKEHPPTLTEPMRRFHHVNMLPH